LVICTYDTQLQKRPSDISYTVCDEAGHGLLDSNKVLDTGNLCNTIKIVQPGGMSGYTICYGSYYPIVKHYAEKTKVLITVTHDGSTDTVVLNFTIE